jgi:MerR family transcriptional regulator, thiopeptide resistance regulator
MTNAHWKIGELAKRTGVSVRTLHHYDEIGLLSPSHRTDAGHRLYGREEVIRLQQIVSLRQVGLPLDEIRRFLQSHAGSAQEVIRMHLARLREQIERQQSLCRRLEALAARFTSAEQASVDDYLDAIEEMTMYDKYFSKEQLDTLAARREQLGEAHLREVEQEWPRLIAQVREEMERGTDPKDPRMQALAKRWQELIAEFTGGDPAIAQATANLYRGEPQVAQQNALDPSLFDYVRKAF